MIISAAPTSSSLSSYALSLQPTLVPARGAFVDALIAANVAPYLSFQLLPRISATVAASQPLSQHLRCCRSIYGLLS
ncbi:hypothetical protein PCASD_21125 [Puccinia coronata f. sp. avenae]|uniref:Uncharacterized protein n=1 Tax=Puccinia coronata f. sp. avenae TaxID=200324 RepID=A0A2N5TK68_9BASI|nr:hypothetical protein PCASD_21125 [Puccinia coronata f. sp. avenae]